MKSCLSLAVILQLSFYCWNLSAQVDPFCGTFTIGSASATSASSTGNTCFSTSNSNNTYDQHYIPQANDEVLTIRYHLHIMQFSSTDPRNFEETNSDHQTYLNGILDFLDGYLDNVRVPWYEGQENPNSYNTISDSRIRMELVDTHYWVDPDGWSNKGNMCNNYVMDTYGEDKECTLNVFIIGDSSAMYSGCAPGYFDSNTNRNFLTFKGWEGYIPPGSGASSNQQALHGRTFLHELGHIGGMLHADVNCGSNLFSDTYCPVSMLDAGCDPQNAAFNDCSSNLMAYSSQTNNISPLQAGHMREQFITKWRSQALNMDYDASKSITISSNETWSYGKIVKGDLTINSGATLTIECLVRLSPGTRIYVKEGGKLIVDGGCLTTKHNSCGGRDMWKGIYVEGDPSKSQTAANQGTLEVKNSATIEYAMNAISTSYNGQSNTGGGIIKLDDSEFINNKRSIEFLPYANSNVSYIDNCTFTYTSTYPLSTTIQHITMWDVRGVDIADCDFSNNSGIQTDGIYTIDAGFSIIDSEFSDLQQGIYVTNSGSSLKNLSAENNTFDVIQNGIRIKAVDNCFVSDNTFTVNTTTSWFYIPTGVYVENSTDYEVTANTFNGPSSTASLTIGSWIYNGGDDYNEVRGNTYNDIYYGNYASGQNRNFTVNTQGLQYLCNENSDNTTDFYVTDFGFTPTSNEGIGAIQGSAGQPAGNVFTKASTPTGSDFNNQSDWSSEYWYNPTVSTHEPVNVVNITLSSTSNDDGCSAMAAFYSAGNQLEGIAPVMQKTPVCPMNTKLNTKKIRPIRQQQKQPDMACKLTKT